MRLSPIDASRLSLLSNRWLYLILMPTEQCQLRCAYCYEDFEQGRMEEGVVRGIQGLMSRRAPELERLAVEWFGGEPLLAFDIVEEVQAFAQKLTREHPSLRFQGSMTTNAMRLDPGRLARLVELGVRRFQISLDGPREIHDRFRTTAGGQGTFERIWGNLLAARQVEGDFEIHLRLHVSRANVEGLADFARECDEAFGADPRFKLAFRGLRRLGGARDADLPVLSEAEQSQALAELSASTRDLAVGLHPGPFEGPDPAPGCYAAAAYSLVVRSNGDLAKCTVALRHPNNRVGRLREDGTVSLDSKILRGWIRGVFTGRVQDLQCPAVGFADEEPDHPPATEPRLLSISAKRSSNAASSEALTV